MAIRLPGGRGAFGKMNLEALYSEQLRSRLAEQEVPNFRVLGILENEAWDDLKFPFSRDKQGQSQKPDFDFAELGLLFPQNDETEDVFLIAQFSHSKKLGTAIQPHIHYIQDETGHPIFEMQYRWYNNGDAVPGWTTIQTENTVFPYSSGGILQILPFPEIEAPHNEAVSSVMDIIIYRQTGDGIVGDVLVKEFDMHYLKNTRGSLEVFRKGRLPSS